MAKIRASAFETPTARLKLAVRRKPYNGPKLVPGVLLLYRRTKTNGSWIVKASNGQGGYYTKAFAQADDFDASNGTDILSFFEAQIEAKKLVRGESDDDKADAASLKAPLTINAALANYERNLIERGKAAKNAGRARPHLTAALLARPVQLLTSDELKDWRDSLIGKIAAATINRICNALRAAFELAAEHDPRIKDTSTWRKGLKRLPGAEQARNVILNDAKVNAFVEHAYADGESIGLLVETLAVTGTRPSQAARLLVRDFIDHPTKPKLMMPKSGKGGGDEFVAKKSERFSVPVTIKLARRLKAACKGRTANAPLLTKADGTWWGDDPKQNYRCAVHRIVTAIGENPAEVTMYALRHSNIVRMLLQNIPIRLVASLHNTSVSQIEKNYSRHITEHSDDLSRAALLSDTVANVIPLAVSR